MLIFLIIIWYITGVILYGRALFNIDGTFTVQDLMVALLAGIFGPFMIFYYIGSLVSKDGNSFWNKRIF